MGNGELGGERSAGQNGCGGGDAPGPELRAQLIETGPECVPTSRNFGGPTPFTAILNNRFPPGTPRSNRGEHMMQFDGGSR